MMKMLPPSTSRTAFQHVPGMGSPWEPPSAVSRAWLASDAAHRLLRIISAFLFSDLDSTPFFSTAPGIYAKNETAQFPIEGKILRDLFLQQFFVEKCKKGVKNSCMFESGFFDRHVTGMCGRPPEVAHPPT